MVKYKRYTHYRDSGIEWIGELPEGWDIKKLKYISNVQLSNVDKKSVDGELPVHLCNYVDVYYNNTISDDLDFMQATAKSEQIKRFKLRKNDVLITKDSESPNDIAIPAWVQKDFEDVLCGYHLAHIRPFGTMNGRYLFYCFDSIRIREQYYTLANGVTRFGLSKDDINSALFYVPKIDEQKQIANFLDQKTAEIDSLIADKEKLIALLEEQRQAIITEAVTKGLNPDVKMKDSGVEWIGEIPENWGIGGLTKYVSSIVDYRGKTPEKVDEGIFLVTAKNIKMGKIDYSLSQEFVKPDEYENIMRRGLPEIGDVVFTTEAPLGEVANIDRTDIALAQRVIKFRGAEDVLNNYYLKYWMLSHGFQNNLQTFATGSTATGIKASKLSQLLILLPTYDEQVQIVNFLDQRTAEIDELISNIETQINKLKEYRQSLIFEAVTGKIDVRDVAVEVTATA